MQEFNRRSQAAARAIVTRERTALDLKNIRQNVERWPY